MVSPTLRVGSVFYACRSVDQSPGMHSFHNDSKPELREASPSDPRHSHRTPRPITGRPLQPCLLLIQLSKPTRNAEHYRVLAPAQRLTIQDAFFLASTTFLGCTSAPAGISPVSRYFRQRDQQLSRPTLTIPILRDLDHCPRRTASRTTCSMSLFGLVPQPAPRQLHHHPPHATIARLADALLTPAAHRWRTASAPVPPGSPVLDGS